MATLFQIIQFFDGNGEPLSGGKVNWYDAGTSTPKDSWIDEAESAAATNPVILDQEGRVPSPQEGMWISGSYKMIITDSDDNVITTIDNINEYDSLDWTGLTATIADLNSTSTETIEIATTYAITAADRGKTILADATTAAFEITIPTSVSLGSKFEITIKKVDSTTNAVTINPAGSETIDDQTTYLLNDYNDFIKMHCDGSNFLVIASQIRGTVLAVSSTTPITLDDNTKFVEADAAGGSFDINLPSAAAVGRGYRLAAKKIDSSTNTISINADGAELIDGIGSLVLSSQYFAATLVSNGANWWVINEFGDVQAGPDLPLGYFSGFKCNQNSGNPTTDVLFETGSARGESDIANIRIDPGSTVNKRITTPWTEGTNQGGFPTALLPIVVDTWYHCFVIAKDDGTTDAGFDTDINAANLLSDAVDYVDYKRVGSVQWITGNVIRDYIQYITSAGTRTVYWITLTDDYTSLTSETTPRTVALQVPLGIYVSCALNYSFHVTSSGISHRHETYFYSLDQADQYPSTGGAPGFTFVMENTQTGGGKVEVMTDNLSQVKFISASSHISAAEGIRISTIGWSE